VWQVIPIGLPALHLQLQAGNEFDLFLRYKFQPETINHYVITIKKHWWQTTFFKLLIILFCLLLIFLLLFYFYQIRKKEQLLKQQKETETITLKLKAIRSQLNPHFIFNCLNSIQSLINTNRIAAANEYLSEFSTLMRDALADSDKIFQHLDKEIKILENYLKLERLRFEFEYTINTSTEIKPNEIEIPSLLLQPLVENAVKHGVSHLREKGKVSINFFKNNTNFIAEIKDNGKGFTDEKQFNGYGWKLTNDKIQLIAGMLKDQKIEKKIFRKDGATFVQIIFKNWL